MANKTAKKSGDLSKRVKHETWEWIKAIVIAILIVIPVKLFVLDTMIVPTGSMIPTIMPGDRIFVDQISWKYKDLKIGDIIVFWTPFVDKSSLAMLGPFDRFMDALSPVHYAGHVKYVKRLIAVGGDTVQLVPIANKYFKTINQPVIFGAQPIKQEVESNKIVYFYQAYEVEINGKIPDGLKKIEYISAGIFNDPNFYKEMAYPNKYINPNYNFFVYYNQDMDYTTYYNSVVSKWGNYVTEDASGNIVIHVPKGYFFAMGDNTTDSFDSRYWGFVPMSNMIGTPFLRIWPLNRFGVMK
ncbi:signal peptidase I [Athalassotoga saccharophila]|uniref:signal peptidase I n=1 Tax=Athalassotoga saccharophila TaxID=1441386 RepID=UPI00137A618C|nr:signal peptidase I [Athalassotoga saccharophila]BBJ27894.1 signal peptidase I [Athalassotoga saccharophila]